MRVSTVVVSVLQQRRYVSSGVKVFSHISPFFIFRAPLRGSTIVSSTISRGKRALHWPFAFRQPFHFTFVASSPSISGLQHLWWFDLDKISSVVAWNLPCHTFRLVHHKHLLHPLFLQRGGGGMGIVWVRSLLRVLWGTKRLVYFRWIQGFFQCGNAEIWLSPMKLIFSHEPVAW